MEMRVVVCKRSVGCLGKTNMSRNLKTGQACCTSKFPNFSFSVTYLDTPTARRTSCYNRRCNGRVGLSGSLPAFVEIITACIVYWIHLAAKNLNVNSGT